VAQLRECKRKQLTADNEIWEPNRRPL